MNIPLSVLDDMSKTAAEQILRSLLIILIKRKLGYDD